MKSYYKFIDGIRYDRSLLEAAERMTNGRGDGRISEGDAEKLLQQARDGNKITDIEKRTLQYIRNHYPWTEKASAYWTTEMGLLVEMPLSFRVGKILKLEFGLEELRTVVDAMQIDLQEALPGNELPFEAALRGAIRSFLNDEVDYESPRSVLRERYHLHPHKGEQADAQLNTKVREYLSKGTLYLLPYFEGPLTDDALDEYPFSPPESGEKPEENWLFGLTLPTLSDHLFWAVVARSGTKPPYCYGSS
jgi:hypothetical protein